MYTMDQVHRIRELFFEQGNNLTEISEIVGCDWRTVRKYVDKEDFSPQPPKVITERESKLDRFKPEIDSWLESDRKSPRKQRHTTKRVFRRLSEEHSDFNVSYRLVAGYVAERKQALRLGKAEGFIPLIHRPAEAIGGGGRPLMR